MVASKGASRATSVASNSAARDLLRRRNKPYKTEQQKIFAKKRPLGINVSYYQQSPPGYTFLAVGTPDLAELCKELSRKRDLPVNVVNAEPVSKNAWNPDKISHHIHRVGYHFRCEVVQEACEALNYVSYEGRFITIVDLQQKQHASVISKAFARQGYNYDRVTGNEETPEQVRAAIKELFPGIPQHDLDEIVTHAWEKNTGRIGSATELPLPRRVQLATIARIRHMYTDYDALLGAFGNWKEVRKEVEPACLRVLMEWRGESGGDDEGLEEIVRETIVIDDDDDDSSDTGDASETSIEISHRPAAVEDLRAEEASERDHRFFQRPQAHDRTLARRTGIAKQKIDEFRTREHNARAHAHNQYPAYGQPIPANLERIDVPSHGPAGPPQQFVVGGRIMRLVQENGVPQQYDPAGRYMPDDRPVQSIERDEGPQPLPAYHSQPTTPRAARPEQRQYHFVDLVQSSPGDAPPLRQVPRYEYDRRQPVPRAYHGEEIVDLTSPRRPYNYGEEIVDLTSPRRPYNERPVAQPEVIRVVTVPDDRYIRAPVDQYGYARTPEHPSQTWRAEEPYLQPLQGRFHDSHAAEYDPNRPLLDAQERVVYKTAPSSRYAPVHGAPAPVQQMSREFSQRQPVYAVPQYGQHDPR